MTRVITGLVLLPLFVYITVWAPWPAFLAVVAIVAVLCFHEYAGLVQRHNIRKPQLYGQVAGLIILLLPKTDLIFIVLIALLALALALAAPETSQVLPFASALVLGVVYVFGCLRAGVELRAISPFWLLFALSVNWVGDVAAFYIGRSWGRHRLAPRISPAKSWEGAIASTVMSIVYAWFYFPHLLNKVPLPWALSIAAAGNIAGQIGDLCESALKRGAAVKDSGTMLPGHGGWLDRVDSSLFALPVVYYLASLRP